jgi:Concanavalin A-like lectin/glucanases superfamily
VSANLTIKVREDLNGEMFGDQAVTGVAAGGSSTLLTGLVGSWKLADLTDSVGTNTLTNNNTVTFNTGKIGNAGYFTAASSMSLSHASNSDLQLGDIDWTIGCWAYLTNNDTEMQIVSKDNETAGNREYNVFYSGTNGNFRAEIFQAADSGISVVGSNFGAASTATWYCALVWWDSIAKTLNLSINDGTANQVTTGVLQAAGGAEFRIGGRQYTGFENYFNGRIDNVNLWKRVLTSGERAEFYNSGTGKEHPFS